MESEVSSSGKSGSPDTVTEENRGVIRLFTPPHVFVAAFLGSFLGGLLLIGYNFYVSHQKESFQRAVLLGAIITPAWLAFLLGMPDTSWDRAFPLATALVMTTVAKICQGRYFSASDRKVEVKFHSMWLVVLIALIALVIQFFLVLPYFLYLQIGG